MHYEDYEVCASLGSTVGSGTVLVDVGSHRNQRRSDQLDHWRVQMQLEYLENLPNI